MVQRIKLNKEPKLDKRHDAFDFQKEAIQAIRDLEYAAVFHEQGLGKTKVAIDVALYWLETKKVDTVLFIAKKSLLDNWIREFGFHTFVKPRVISQNRRENYFTFNSPARIMIAHFEVIKSEQQRFTLFLKTRNVGVIVDESAKIKNPDTKITKAFFALSPLFCKRIIMTGTPVANRPYDIWSQIWFLDHGRSLGDNYKEFIKNYDLSNRLLDDEEKRQDFEKRLSELFGSISSFAVRETKNSARLELPEKVYNKTISDWEQIQYSLYEKIRNDLRAVVVKEGIPKEDDAELILKRLLRLVQIASNPILVDDLYDAEPGKWPLLFELIERNVRTGDKSIVWTTFTENADWLSKMLIEFQPCVVHGKLPIVKRNKELDLFQNDDECRVLIATPGAAKEGLTLTVANHVIFYDRSFSLDDYLQAQDRIHRISQKKVCHVTNIVMRDSIDEWVDVLLHAKHLAAQLAQGDISLEYYQSQINYSFAEMIREILGIE